MVTTLYIVPSTHLRQVRRRLSREAHPAQAVTLGGLAAQILKEGLVSYREDRILEEVALWQSVEDAKGSLKFFAPIVPFTGFIQELKWLFGRLDYGEDIFALMPEQGRAELELLHNRYHGILAECGVVNAPGRIRMALRVLEKGRVLSEVSTIRLQGLGELRPLEQDFLHALAAGRTLEVVELQTQEPTVEVIKAPDPTSEVELIGASLRHQIEAGAALEKLAVAFPNPAQYLPMVIPVFERMQIPWQTPAGTLRNTPVGKALLTLIAGELGGWDKHHLELLTAPGWGFPFALTGEEHRLLRLAPPLKGLPAWRSYLGTKDGWVQVLDILGGLGAELITRPLREYGAWLERLLEKLDPELWVKPQDNLEVWAELVKAWDSLYAIAGNLGSFHWTISPERFLQLLQELLDSYQIRAKREFAERVQVLGIEQLGAHTYEHLYVGGLVEGQFPPHRTAHWLTKTAAVLKRDELYRRLISSAPHLYLHYPEVDREGKLNLPATILPKVEDGERTAGLDPSHHPSLFLGDGRLRDAELLSQIKERVLQGGLTVSQLNSYASCPYRFFCDYVLALEVLEEESLELDARDKGIIIHNVLRDFWTSHLTGPLPAVEEAQAQVEGLLIQAYLERGSEPPAALIRSMRAFIRQDVKRAESGFRPAYLEQVFQNVVIPTDFGSVSVRGRIDRIDQHPDGAYVLYDYKTGTPPTIAHLLEGRDVQIAAYLLASETLLPQGRNVGAAYYMVSGSARRGVFHADYHKQLCVRKGKNILAAEEFAQQQDKFREILAELVTSILEGAFPIEPASTSICRYCPFQGICRKEVGMSGF